MGTFDMDKYLSMGKGISRKPEQTKCNSVYLGDNPNYMVSDSSVRKANGLRPELHFFVPGNPPTSYVSHHVHGGDVAKYLTITKLAMVAAMAKSGFKFVNDVNDGVVVSVRLILPITYPRRFYRKCGCDKKVGIRQSKRQVFYHTKYCRSSCAEIEKEALPSFDFPNITSFIRFIVQPLLHTSETAEHLASLTTEEEVAAENGHFQYGVVRRAVQLLGIIVTKEYGTDPGAEWLIRSPIKRDDFFDDLKRRQLWNRGVVD